MRRSGRARVLFVEDDGSVAEALSRFLAIEGFEVVVARSGESALILLLEGAFDAMVLIFAFPAFRG